MVMVTQYCECHQCRFVHLKIDKAANLVLYIYNIYLVLYIYI